MCSVCTFTHYISADILLGFHNLKKLRHLSLSSNLIKSLLDCGLGKLPHLEFLDISDNLIGSLEGVGQCSNLQLLYTSNNKITDCREVLHLKVHSSENYWNHPRLCVLLEYICVL